MTTPHPRPTLCGVPIPPTTLVGLPSLLADCAHDGVTLVDAVDAERDLRRWVREHAEPVRA